MAEEKKVPAWKAFEDAELRKKQLEEQTKALSDVKSYLTENNVVFIESENQEEEWLLKISTASLISRKELLKLLDLTLDKLGIQLYQQQLQIYQLHSKISDYPVTERKK